MLRNNDHFNSSHIDVKLITFNRNSNHVRCLLVHVHLHVLHLVESR